jgi:serine/threonine-protein kinase
LSLKGGAVGRIAIADVAPREVPRKLDCYELVRPIGRGGMAEVFHARFQRIGGFEREVAVKVILPEYGSESEFIEMLLDEARIAGAINHPNVVQVIDVGQKDGHFYLVMELVDGADLRSLLKKAPRQRLPLPAALYVASEVLRGLTAVHTAVDGGGVPRRIVHRDVSPANVMISRLGAVKLGDFGIAHAASRLTRTRAGALKGKLKYIAPEQIKGCKVDHRADLYAAGVMLCEMLLGGDACEPSRMTPYGRIFAWSPQLGRCLPPDVAQILERTLAEDPGRRFADATQLRQRLQAALHQRQAGYGADELARDLAALDEGFLSEMPTIASEAIEINTDPGGETRPQIDTGDLLATGSEVAPRLAPLASPIVNSAPPVRPTQPMPMVAKPYVPSAPVNLKKRMWSGRTAVWTAAAAGAAALAVAALLLTGASSAAQPPIEPLRAPVVTPLQPPREPTGILAIEGPPGASVTIGATVYPAGELALPPGEYQLILKNKRGRAYARRVTIAAGAVTPIKL